jgi:hypothetical protein
MFLAKLLEPFPNGKLNLAWWLGRFYRRNG